MLSVSWPQLSRGPSALVGDGGLTSRVPELPLLGGNRGSRERAVSGSGEAKGVWAFPLPEVGACPARIGAARHRGPGRAPPRPGL